MKARRWIALAALPAAMAVIYGLDRWLAQIVRVAGETFNFASLFWMTTVIDLLYAGVILGLFLLLAPPISRWVGAVYAITGAVVVGYPYLGRVVLAPLLPVLRKPPFNFQPFRGPSLMGAFILAIGVWLIVRRNPVVAEEQDS